MRTTFLNPAVWLLIAVVLSALAGALRGRTARQSFVQFLAFTTGRPALLVLLVMAAGGLASRAALGYLSPGAYAEEVVSARAFLDQREVYGADARAELSQWLSEEPAIADPWALPGISPCQGSAMAQRPQFFTSQGHPPTLLLASVPVVSSIGGRGLYILLLVAALAALAAILAVLLSHAGLPWHTRGGLLIAAALAGWQPVMASVRQGDAVLIAAAAVAVSWHFSRQRPRRVLAGVGAGIAAALALPAIGATAALLRSRPRAGAAAVGVIAASLVLTVAAAGPLILTDFAATMVFVATTYAVAPMNYAVVARVAGLDTGSVMPALVIVACVLLSAWRARTVDTAFASFVALGLVVAPVVWSQHLTLMIVPLAVLLRQVLQHGSSVRLAAWGALALLLSLPDPAILALSALLTPASSSGAPLSVAPFLPVTLWLWLLCEPDVPGRRHESAYESISAAA